MRACLIFNSWRRIAHRTGSICSEDSKRTAVELDVNGILTSGDGSVGTFSHEFLWPLLKLLDNTYPIWNNIIADCSRVADDSLTPGDELKSRQQYMQLKDG
jgi:hypothetical protein